MDRRRRRAGGRALPARVGGERPARRRSGHEQRDAAGRRRSRGRARARSSIRHRPQPAGCPVPAGIPRWSDARGHWPVRTVPVRAGTGSGRREAPVLPSAADHPRRGASMTSIVDAVAVPLHVGIGHRGPSRQALRPGLRRDPRRVHPGRSRGPRRLRVGDDDRPRHGPRRDLDEGRLRRRPHDRPRDRSRHRLHEGRVRLRLPDLRHARLDQGAVVRHRPGRRRGARGARGRRPLTSWAPATRG